MKSFATSLILSLGLLSSTFAEPNQHKDLAARRAHTRRGHNSAAGLIKRRGTNIKRKFNSLKKLDSYV